MKKVIVFGASGNAGKEISREAVRQGYQVSVVVRSKKAAQFSGLEVHPVIADVTNPDSLQNICAGYDVVISSLGKSVSPNDKSKATFFEVDFTANSYILEEAKKSGIKKFVYVSAFHSEKYLHLAYFKVHHDFSEKLKQSGMDYSIIKPPALFSAFTDMIAMARKGQLISIGTGDKKTNPIYEGDLAKICVDAIKETNVIIEAGGKHIYTRKQLAEIVQHSINPNKALKTLPLGLSKYSLPLIRLFNRNMYDKFSFFIEVMQQNTVAPQLGEMKFEEYIMKKSKDG